jgi:hypothetical protein
MWSCWKENTAASVSRFLLGEQEETKGNTEITKKTTGHVAPRCLWFHPHVMPLHMKAEV